MATSQDISDRRASERYPAHLVVVLQPATAERQPIQAPLDAVSIDLSTNGLCCISDRPLLADFAIVRVQAAATEQEMVLFAQRVRCQRNGPMFEIALQFIEKVAEPAATRPGRRRK